MLTDVEVQPGPDGATFFVKIVPGSSKTACAGQYDNKLKLKVAAPPEKGKANRCLIDYLARQLNIKPQTLSIQSGQTSPVKQILVTGLSPGALREKLAALLP